MPTRAYTVLGWVVWQFASRAMKSKAKENSHKLAAAGVIALVVAGGVAAARANSD
jgi:hypothetical protein